MNKDNILWIVILLLSLSIVGYVSEFFVNFRLDFTDEGQYTLSNSTKEVLQELDDKVSIRAVFSENLPAQFAQIHTHVKDLLQEFENAGKGNISLSFEDPGRDSLRRMDVIREGIQEINVTEQTRDGAVAKRGFFGMVLSYGDKKEVVPLVDNLQGFEYDLVVRIKKMSGGRRTIGVVEGNGTEKLMFMIPSQPPQQASGFEQLYPSLKAQLEQLYDIRVIDATEVIPDDVALLFVAAPRSLSESEQKHIDEYIQKGRNALFLTPVLDLQFSQGLNANVLIPNWHGMLQKYGFTIQPNLVMDVLHGNAFFERSMFGTPYPLFVAAQDTFLNRDNAITSQLHMLMLPWTSSLDLAPADSQVQTIVLAQSTPQSWAQQRPFDIIPKNPNLGEQYIPTNQQAYTLAGMRTGRIPSAFGNGSASQSATVMVVPNMLFATDFFVQWSSQGIAQNTTENILFLMNAVDYLALDPKLIQIRSKKIIQRPISEQAYQSRYKWIGFNMLLAPVLLLVIGLYAGWRRRKRTETPYRAGE
jgi:gliding-associated putative ABC transporter substrate-binding component GldG